MASLMKSITLPEWLMICWASCTLKSWSTGTITAPYVRVAMYVTTHCIEFLPMRAILSPCRTPHSLNSRCVAAMRRARSAYVMVEPEP